MTLGTGSLVWRRRTGGWRRAHLFVDGAPACGYAGMLGSLFVEIEPTELTADGLPIGGQRCEYCVRSFSRSKGRP